jgi:hypothetical protein
MTRATKARIPTYRLAAATITRITLPNSSSPNLKSFTQSSPTPPPKADWEAIWPAENGGLIFRVDGRCPRARLRALDALNPRTARPSSGLITIKRGGSQRTGLQIAALHQNIKRQASAATAFLQVTFGSCGHNNSTPAIQSVNDHSCRGFLPWIMDKAAGTYPGRSPRRPSARRCRRTPYRVQLIWTPGATHCVCAPRELFRPGEPGEGLALPPKPPPAPSIRRRRDKRGEHIKRRVISWVKAVDR